MIREQEIMLGDRHVGRLRSDGTYVSYRDKSHFFRKFLGFGISTSTLMEIRKKGCNRVVIVYTREDGTQEVYATYPDKFLEKGIIWRHKDAEWQRILPLKEFDKQGGKNDKNTHRGD